jgi:hypothetical protein
MISSSSRRSRILERLTVIGYDDITDAGMEHLRGMKLKRLFLVSEKVTIKTAEVLGTMTDLAELTI